MTQRGRRLAVRRLCWRPSSLVGWPGPSGRWARRWAQSVGTNSDGPVQDDSGTEGTAEKLSQAGDSVAGRTGLGVKNHVGPAGKNCVGPDRMC